MSLYDLLERLCIFSDLQPISKPPVELKLGFADVAQMIATLGSCLNSFYIMPTIKPCSCGFPSATESSKSHPPR